MKIIQVLTRGDVPGGAQTHVYELSIALHRAGHDVTVLTGPGGPLNRSLSAAGIAQRSLPYLVRPVSPWRDLRALVSLFQELRSLEPDLVCAHTAKAGWLARIAARALEIPCTFTPHGWSPMDRSTLTLHRGYLFLERLAGALGTRIINVCESEKAMAVDFRLAPPALLEVVHNGIADLDRERLAPLDRQPPRIVMTARYQVQKNHEALLQALAALKHLPWNLTLIGDGEGKHCVERRISDLELTSRVELLPGNTDAAGVLAAAQIFVLPSRFEAFPISILEAMRAAVPVIATDVGGIHEAVVHGRTGFLVPPQESSALSRALGKLIEDPALRVTMGLEGKARFCAQFTSDTMLARTLDVYARACTQPVPRELAQAR